MEQPPLKEDDPGPYTCLNSPIVIIVYNLPPQSSYFSLTQATYRCRKQTIGGIPSNLSISFGCKSQNVGIWATWWGSVLTVFFLVIWLHLIKRKWCVSSLGLDLKHLYITGETYSICEWLKWIKSLYIVLCARVGTVCMWSYGFKKKRNTVIVVFTAWQLQDKCRVQHQNLLLVFVNLSKPLALCKETSCWISSLGLDA